MTTKDYVSTVDPTLRALLENGRLIPPVPAAVRARSLARARAQVSFVATAMPLGAPVVARRRGLSFALAASALLLAVAAVAEVAWRSHLLQLSSTPTTRPQSGVPPRITAPTPVEIAPAPPTSPKAEPTGRRSPPTQTSYAAELALLQRAQAAYARTDATAALALLAEHRRRFPDGRLAEEREGLRVRALASAGRREEARRAAAAFAKRFPRSVLLPSLTETPE